MNKLFLLALIGSLMLACNQQETSDTVVQEGTTTSGNQNMEESDNSEDANRVVVDGTGDDYDFCKIIRKVSVNKEYEVQEDCADCSVKILLLDICPKTEKDYRPSIDVGDKKDPILVEYDFLKEFSDQEEAIQYANKNNILDVTF